MSRNGNCLIVGAALMVAGCAGDQSGDTAPAKITSVPVFEVDKSWPKMPPQW